MNIVRLFLADQNVSKKNVLIAIVALTWFGFSTNSLFELWKLIPTVFVHDSKIDWLSLFLYITPPASFLIFVLPKIQATLTIGRQNQSGASQTVAKHKGLILALSKPVLSPEEIKGLIAKADSPDNLYDIQGIGQLFRGIYHHNDVLMHLWLITTKQSKLYKSCVEEFIKKFMTSVCCENDDRCEIPDEEPDREIIELVKTKLAALYAHENLHTFALKSSDIIVDITGGTRPISLGLTLGALDSVIDIQYIEQKDKNVIPLAISPEIILDKVGVYLLELYAKTRELRNKER